MPYLHLWVFPCRRCHHPMPLPAVFPEPGYERIEKTWRRFDLHCGFCFLMQTVNVNSAIRFPPRPWRYPATPSGPQEPGPQHPYSQKP